MGKKSTPVITANKRSPTGETKRAVYTRRNPSPEQFENLKKGGGAFREGMEELARSRTRH